MVRFVSVITRRDKLTRIPFISVLFPAFFQHTMDVLFSCVLCNWSACHYCHFNARKHTNTNTAFPDSPNTSRSQSPRNPSTPTSQYMLSLLRLAPIHSEEEDESPPKDATSCDISPNTSPPQDNVTWSETKTDTQTQSKALQPSVADTSAATRHLEGNVAGKQHGPYKPHGGGDGRRRRQATCCGLSSLLV